MRISLMVRVKIYSFVAQLVERLAVNQDVTGSSPVGRALELILNTSNYSLIAQW